MLAVRAGDSAPLAELFARHHRSLFHYFRKLGYRRSDSEDLVQDTFMRILKYAHSYNADGHFSAWLYRVARNSARDTWQPQAAMQEEVTEDSAIAPRHYEPTAIASGHDEQALLQRALMRLPRDRRELILLSRVKELSHEDLAALFDCNVNAIKVRLHRSLAQLQEYFQQAKGEHERPLRTIQSVEAK